MNDLVVKCLKNSSILSHNIKKEISFKNHSPGHSKHIFKLNIAKKGSQTEKNIQMSINKVENL